MAREKATTDKEAPGEFDREWPGSCGAQDPFYVWPLKGGGLIYQQTFMDTSSTVGAPNSITGRPRLQLQTDSTIVSYHHALSSTRFR